MQPTIKHLPHLAGSSVAPVTGTDAQTIAIVCHRTKASHRPEALLETFAAGEVFGWRFWWSWHSSHGNHEAAGFATLDAARAAGVAHSYELAQAIARDPHANTLHVQGAMRWLRQIGPRVKPGPRVEYAPASQPEPARGIPCGPLFGAVEHHQGGLFAEPAPAPFEPFIPSPEVAAALAADDAKAHQATTWPPAWHKASPADARIAKQYQPNATSSLF